MICRLGSFVKGDRKPIHLVHTIGKTRIFIFKYRPFGRRLNAFCWRSLFQLNSGADILMSLGIPSVQGHSIPNSSNESKDMDTGTTQESLYQENEVTVSHPDGRNLYSKVDNVSEMGSKCGQE